MRKKQDPVAQRRGQIEREIEKLRNPKNGKSKNDFKSDEAFENWSLTLQAKLDSLYEESTMLVFPDAYNEVPLAVAAQELGIGLSEIQWVVSEGLLEVSSESYYAAGARITREELGRAIDVGPEELLRRARLEIPEIFKEALSAIANEDVGEIRKLYARIDQRDSCINPYALACEVAIQFLTGDITELQSSIKFILERDFDDLPAAIDALRSVMRALPVGTHALEVIREQALSIAEGTNVKPFRETYSPYKGTQFPSQMTENQNLAVFIGDVVRESIERYKFIKWMQSSRPLSESREEELVMVIQNAIYTALEARRTYHDSPSSKMFVDRYMGVRPTRRKPPELMQMLPKGK